MYQNTSNIIALLEGESGIFPNGTIGTSLLVNCHYDSVPFALGKLRIQHLVERHINETFDKKRTFRMRQNCSVFRKESL